MDKRDEYINVTNFLKVCSRGLENEGTSIHQKNFRFSRYACCMEIGDPLLDFGIHPENRISIKECEDKNYIHKNIELSEYPILIDLHLIHILAILNGSHPYLTLYSSYFLHHSKIIPCKDKFYIEGCFRKFLNIISSCDDDSTLSSVERFLNNNLEYVLFCEDCEDIIDELKRRNKKNKKKKEKKTEEYYVKAGLFVFYEIFLIFFASGFILIDYFICRNYLVHKDDYINEGTTLRGTLVDTCRDQIFCILKNWEILRKCILQFIERFEKEKTETEKNEKEKNEKEKNETEKNETEKTNKDFLEILKRLKFITCLVSILFKIKYLSEESRGTTEKNDKTNKQENIWEHISIQNECDEAIKCIESIEETLNGSRENGEKEGEKRKEREEKVAAKYFSIYLLMHQVERASKYVPNISVNESYTHYKNILKDIQFVDSHYTVIPFQSSYLEITNMAFYHTCHSYSDSLLFQCIAQLYMQRLSKEWKEMFEKKEKAHIKEYVDFEKNHKTPMNNTSFNKGQNGEHNWNWEGEEKLQKEKKEKEGCSDQSAINNNVSVVPPFKKKENNFSAYGSQPYRTDEQCKSDDEIFLFCDLIYSVYNQDYIVTGKEKGKNDVKRKQLYENLKNDIYVNFFFLLFYEEWSEYIDLFKDGATELYVKHNVYYDLISWGFSPDLLMLLTNFIYMPETFFFNVEHKFQINLNIGEYPFGKVLNRPFHEIDTYYFELINERENEIIEEGECMDSSSSNEMSATNLENNNLKKDVALQVERKNRKHRKNNKKKNEIRMDQFRQRVSAQFPGVIPNIQHDVEEEKPEGNTFLYLSQFVEEFDFSNVKMKRGEEETHESARGKKANTTLEMEQRILKDVKDGENVKEVEEGEKETRNTNHIIMRNRMKFVILCKLFDMFFQLLCFTLSRILYISFLPAARQHVLVKSSEIEIRTLYYIMKGLVAFLRVYNLKKEIEVIQNYFSCILQNFQISVVCLSLCIHLPTARECAQTYYVLSACFKEMADRLLKAGESENFILEEECTLQKKHKTRYNMYAFFYTILSQCCDCLLIYFIYITYTNINLNHFEETIFNFKYGKWKNVFIDFCKFDFSVYSENKELLRHALICKALQIDSSNASDFFADPNNRTKIKNLTKIEETYKLTKEVVNKFKKDSSICNSCKISGIINKEMFPIFKDSITDVDVSTYLRNLLKQIKENMKQFIKQSENTDAIVTLKILHSFIQKCYEVFDDNSFTELPMLRIENTDLCLDSDFDVIKQHPLFWKIRFPNVTEKRKDEESTI